MYVRLTKRIKAMYIRPINATYQCNVRPTKATYQGSLRSKQHIKAVCDLSAYQVFLIVEVIICVCIFIFDYLI